MHFEALTHWSSHLNREMFVNRYGHAGLPVLVFPSSGGSHHEYANFGMIEACREIIDSGQLQFWTLSSIDGESWLDLGKSMHDRALTYQNYDAYLIREGLPFIKHKTGWFDPMMVTGCSMGAYHALNAFLRHPDAFNQVIALSGVYDVRFFGGEFGDDMAVYYHSPVDYLWKQEDDWFLKHYRASDIIVCTGQGAWEEDGLPSYYRLKQAFIEKKIPAWFDVWGVDVTHDWKWWRMQMPYFLKTLGF